MRVARFVLPILQAAFVLGFLCAPLACDDATSPGTPITLETIWPNENGRKWEYSWTETIFEGAVNPDTAAIYPSQDGVPPAPDISEILPLVDDPSIPQPVDIHTREWGLMFQDSTTTLSGVTAQNLLEISDSTALQSLPPKARLSPFVTNLLQARPDLRDRIRSLGGSAFVPQHGDSIELALIVLHGGAWERTTGWIGMYGDLDSELAWMYMDSTLTTGHRFSLQLIPSIVDDAFLHGLVRRTVSIDTAAGTFGRALEIVYLIDFGVAQATDPLSGDPIGYFRTVNYGKVVYVPNTGPVAAYERMIVSVSENLGTGIGEVSLDLTGIEETLTTRH